MTAADDKKTENEDISERLKSAIDSLRKDVTRVEVWATALGGFAQPVPDYRPNEKFELKQTPKKGGKSPSRNG